MQPQSGHENRDLIRAIISGGSSAKVVTWATEQMVTGLNPALGSPPPQANVK